MLRQLHGNSWINYQCKDLGGWPEVQWDEKLSNATQWIYRPFYCHQNGYSSTTDAEKVRTACPYTCNQVFKWKPGAGKPILIAFTQQTFCAWCVNVVVSTCAEVCVG